MRRRRSRIEQPASEVDGAHTTCHWDVPAAYERSAKCGMPAELCGSRISLTVTSEHPSLDSMVDWSQRLSCCLRPVALSIHSKRVSRANASQRPVESMSMEAGWATDFDFNAFGCLLHKLPPHRWQRTRAHRETEGLAGKSTIISQELLTAAEAGAGASSWASWVVLKGGVAPLSITFEHAPSTEAGTVPH